MLNMICLGHSPLSGQRHDKINIIPFANYAEFLSCRLTLKKIDAFLCAKGEKLENIIDIVSTYPEATIIMVDDFDHIRELDSYLKAGVHDFIMRGTSPEDACRRILTRVRYNRVRLSMMPRLAGPGSDGALAQQTPTPQPQ